MRSQLHAGQLRYHPFTPLREAHLRRLRFSTSTLTTPLQTLHPFSTAPQTRPFLTSLRENLKLKSYERAANADPQNLHLQYQFLASLSQKYPTAVMERFDYYPQFAVDERIALLYLEALQRTGGIKSFNGKTFLKRLNESGNGAFDPLKLAALEELVSDSKASKQSVAVAALRILSGGGGVGAASLAGAAASPLAAGVYGSNPNTPLYIQYANKINMSQQLWTTFRWSLGLFVLVSAVSVFIDGRGVGSAIGMGGKHVQEAEGSNVKFEDVKGVEEAKAELEEIVLYLKDPERFTRLGGKLPRGLLLTGPPGTGKTLLAKAIAGEAGVPFFFSSGSQFEEVYVGLGAKRIRELFETAKKKSPAIIFIDEIDAVGGSRKLKDQSALKMTLNELLVQMDGFEENSGIIVVGATNFAQSLDKALLRPGRFDKHVTVPLPDIGGRKDILSLYAQKTRLSADVDLDVLARGTPGLAGADLANLMNQAALKASVEGLPAIDMKTLEYAKDKILMGAERKTAVITAENAKNTAYHEAGHALVAVLTDGADQIHKATIMPRGNSLGMVTQLPSGDQKSLKLKEMLARLDVCMGGRIAEELFFGKENVTSGASSDIQQATRMARAMVTKWGFSDEVGIVYHEGETGENSASSHTRAMIDKEVKKLVSESYQRTTELMKKHRKEHILLAETLLEYETLTGDEVRDVILKGKKPNRPIINKQGGARGDQSILENGKPGRRPGATLGGKVGASSRNGNW